MTDWTIGRKLFSTFGALLALVLFASGVSAWVSSQLNAALDEAIGQTHEVALTWKLSDTVTSLGGLQRDAILTAGTQDRSAVSALAAVGPMLDREVDELTRALAEQSEQALARDVREGLREWEQITSEVLKLAGAGERDRALELARVKGDPIIARAEGLVSTLLEGHEEAIAGAEAEGEQLKARTTLTLIAIVVAVLLVGAAAVWIVRGVNRSLQLATEDLRGGAEQVAAASVQVSTSAQSLSQGATEQAASLEETSASMEEIAATTRQNREHSQQAAELMADVHRQVTQFNEAVQTLVRSMAGIRDSSDRVSKILKTIDEIAFQTNILALNAAVEAARAGDAGMGFAVVADEVRSLSQRSAVAAKNTADLVEASNAAAAQGVREMDQAVKAIAEITANVAKVNVLVEEVSLGSQQQAQGIDQVTQAISQLETVTQTTAATSEESAAASEELSTQAETTMAVVQRLAAMVNGANAGEPATTAEPARRKGNVLPLSRPGAPTRARLRNPEREIPLADTGSFGKF